MGKDDQELGSFKIGDLRRPEVRSGGGTRSGGSAEPAPESTEGVGFPAIEARLENGTIEDLADALRPSYEQLEALATGGDMKAKAGAKKAMVAYERTADLMEYLFATKEALQNPAEPQE